MNNDYDWVPGKKLLGGLACVEHMTTKELSLAGLYGEIWQYSDGQFRAIIFSARIAKRFLPKAQWPKVKGDETPIRFSKEELSIWVKRVAVPRLPKTQAKIMRKRGLKTCDAKSNIVELKPLFSSLDTPKSEYAKPEGDSMDRPEIDAPDASKLKGKGA